MGPHLLFLLLLLMFLSLMVHPALARVRHPVPVLWMMPPSSGSGGRQNLSAGVDAAIRLALQDLEKQPPPLGNYEMQLHLVDTQCDPAQSLKALFDTLWAGPRFLLLLGGVCPSVTDIIAPSLPALNLVQVSFVDMSPSLSNRRWFRNLFSLLPSDRAINQATVKLLQHYNWTRVGLVTEETPRLAQMKKDLIPLLLKVQIQVMSSQSLSEHDCSALQRLKDLDVRIIIAHVAEDSASELFCCAHSLRLFGARYQWIVFDGGTGGWRLGWRPSACKVGSLLAAADGAIRLQIGVLADTNAPGISGRTPQNYQDSYLRGVQEVRVDPLHAFAYDAVWVAAAALSQVKEVGKRRLKFNQEGKDEEGAEPRMLLDAMEKIKFDGVTGPVQFRDGQRMSTIQLIQFQGSSGVLVAHFSTSTQQLHLQHHLLKFKGQRAPRDRSLLHPQRLHVDVLLCSAVASTAAVTVVITLTVFCLVLFQRTRWKLRTWSNRSQDTPHLLLVLLLGLLLCSSSVLLSALDGASVSDWMFELRCSVRLWTLSVGHTVVLSVLFYTTWTLYFLCRVKQKQQQQQQQQQQCGHFLLGLFLLEVLVLTTWQMLDPLRRVELQHGSQVDPVDPDVVVLLFSDHCSSTYMELWITAVCGHRGPLLALACFLSWNVRSVSLRHPGAVSGQQLMLSVLSLTAFSSSGLTTWLLTTHYPTVQLAVCGCLVLCCNLCILGFLFAPTILRKGGDSGGGSGGGGVDCVGEPQSETEEDGGRMRRVNEQLRSRNAELDAEMETIVSRFHETMETGTNNGEGAPAWRGGDAGSTDDKTSHRKHSSPDDVNSPELMRRRLSLQLPILHHSYLPVIGGVCSHSSSSVFGSGDALSYNTAATAAMTSSVH